jgi:hypothetical protein
MIDWEPNPCAALRELWNSSPDFGCQAPGPKDVKPWFSCELQEPVLKAGEPSLAHQGASGIDLSSRLRCQLTGSGFRFESILTIRETD